MSTKDLSSFDTSLQPDAKGWRIGIIVSEWNAEITEPMFNAAKEILKKAGCLDNDLLRHDVPGSFELPLGAKWLIDTYQPDAVICIGCVIQGETRHFEFICQAVASGIMQLGIDHGTPVIFGVLTTDTLQQAKDRSGGKFGNKGVEAAMTALRMIALRKAI